MATKDDVVIPAFVSYTKTWHNRPYPAIEPTRPELSAAGKNVVVTGGGTGIGKSIAIAFAQAGAASVSTLGRRKDRLVTSSAAITAAVTDKKTLVLYEVADLTKAAEVQQALKSITERVGEINIFVSNAGVLPTPGPVSTLEPEAFEYGFNLNVRTTLNAVQAFIPLAAPNAVLINVSTGIAHFAPIPGMSAYASSKAMNTKLIDYVAAENPQLHVINLQPGVVDTEINVDTSMKGQDDIGLPGAFSVWLASPEAAFLKSKFVWVNWDVDELKAKAEEIEKTKVLTTILDGVPM